MLATLDAGKHTSCSDQENTVLAERPVTENESALNDGAGKAHVPESNLSKGGGLDSPPAKTGRASGHN